jgi:hypothetical protein
MIGELRFHRRRDANRFVKTVEVVVREALAAHRFSHYLLKPFANHVSLLICILTVRFRRSTMLVQNAGRIGVAENRDHLRGSHLPGCTGVHLRWTQGVHPRWTHIHLDRLCEIYAIRKRSRDSLNVVSRIRSTSEIRFSRDPTKSEITKQT